MIGSLLERWLGTSLPQLSLLFLGVLLVILAVTALWEQRFSRPVSLLGILTGLLMTAAALEGHLNQIVVGITPVSRIRLTTVLLGFSLLLTTFLLLLACHFSLAIAKLEKTQLALWRRISRLEGGAKELADIPAEVPRTRLRACRRPTQGIVLAALLIILMATASVFWVGMIAPQVMIGDEVTHYYMLQTQVSVLPQPNFKARIPTAWGVAEMRTYPHPFLWHYLGAVLFRLSGGSFAAVQFYQTMYLLQFLVIAFLLARSRGGIGNKAVLPYLLTLASLPMSLIFSVTFYQDVPMAAQVLTAFFLLRKGRWFAASLFMAFAMAVKVNAMLFFPAFFLCLLAWTVKRHSRITTTAIFACSLSIIVLCAWGLNTAIKTYTGGRFYPVEKFRELVRMAEEIGDEEHEEKVEDEFIANHPGDLRIAANYFIYGGLLLWLLVLAGAASEILRRANKQPDPAESDFWLWGTGLSYTLTAAFFLASSPDARFFLPGLPFLLLPLSERVVRLPWSKGFISFFASLAVLQAGHVLAKTYQLRQLSPPLRQAIGWLRQHPPQPSRIFMYPEGNYRFFPVPHDWYLDSSLRDFWRADNKLRIELLHRFGIGAIVIKKHLIAPVDAEITDLGVYPDYFVRSVRQDSRFPKLFENSVVLIVQVPR